MHFLSTVYFIKKKKKLLRKNYNNYKNIFVLIKKNPGNFWFESSPSYSNNCRRHLNGLNDNVNFQPFILPTPITAQRTRRLNKL